MCFWWKRRIGSSPNAPAGNLGFRLGGQVTVLTAEIFVIVMRCGFGVLLPPLDSSGRGKAGYSPSTDV